MKTNNTKKNRNDTRSAKVNRDQKNCKKEPYIPDLFDKPAIEVAEVGVPLDMEACPGTDSNEPTLVDKEHYGKIYTVTDGSFYTIRLGIHSSSLGVGSMNEDCAVVCAIPTTSDKTQRLMALFFIPEIYPVKFMDAIWLHAKNDRQFKLEYVFGSAALESNNDSRAFPLRHDAITEEDDHIMILQNGIEGEIPAFCTFAYDFIRFQVKVVFEE
ncbi:hypothetical protein E5329_22335 [Petralouisia muris]|uniref:Uncharacterized protein n=1 Tax=Petralouisia muris TaxID=3032872 RepID=A0AC61RRG9_9FIRM|nr:hypothetical protein [Petralouisia muris]TGY91208.1 hypothetical protein E5329_22335 [Petralouisia muris]